MAVRAPDSSSSTQSLPPRPPSCDAANPARRVCVPLSAPGASARRRVGGSWCFDPQRTAKSDFLESIREGTPDVRPPEPPSALQQPVKL
jgi:hypothetical protein